MRNLVLVLGMLAFCTAGPAAESKALKKASLAATEQMFAEPRIFEVSVEVPQAQLDALRKEPRVYVKATVREGTNVYANTGFRFKGTNVSSKTSRPSFTLKFNEFITDQRFQGQRKLGFDSSEHDPSYLGEPIANELFRSAGIPAPRTTFARMKINGKDAGVYVVSEGVNKDFLDRHFDTSKGNLYEGDGTDLTDTLDKDSGDGVKTQPDVKALVDAAKEPNVEQRWKKLQALLDVDRFVTFVAMEALVGHTNGYALAKGRYRIYNDPGRGLMVFMPHGIEAVFSKPEAPIVPEMKGLLAKAVLETPEGKKRYREEVKKIVGRTFRLDLVQARAKELSATIKPALKENAEAHEKAVTEFMNRLTARHKFAEQQIKSL
jgi:spore coat protein H